MISMVESCSISLNDDESMFSVGMHYKATLGYENKFASLHSNFNA
jgi:hypothetical protein